MAGENVTERIVRKVFSRRSTSSCTSTATTSRRRADGSGGRSPRSPRSFPSLSEDSPCEPIFVREALGRPLEWTGVLPRWSRERVDRSLPRALSLRAIARGCRGGAMNVLAGLAVGVVRALRRRVRDWATPPRSALRRVRPPRASATDSSGCTKRASRSHPRSSSRARSPPAPSRSSHRGRDRLALRRAGSCSRGRGIPRAYFGSARALLMREVRRRGPTVCATSSRRSRPGVRYASAATLAAPARPAAGGVRSLPEAGTHAGHRYPRSRSSRRSSPTRRATA